MSHLVAKPHQGPIQDGGAAFRYVNGADGDGESAS
jgi:hypothetical protein